MLQRLGVTPNTEYDDLPQLMSVTECSTYCRVSRWAIYQAVRGGRLPTKSVGKKILIPKEAVALTPAREAAQRREAQIRLVVGEMLREREA